MGCGNVFQLVVDELALLLRRVDLLLEVLDDLDAVALHLRGVNTANRFAVAPAGC